MVPSKDPSDVEFIADAFRDSPMASIVLSAEGNVLLWNVAAEHLFGWSEAEVLGKPLPFIPADRMQEHRQMRRRDLEGGGLTNRPISRVRKDGAPLELTVSTAPIRNSSGAVTGIISLYTDVSVQRGAEERLRLRQALADEQLEQLERFYADAPVGLGFLDTELQFVRVNERMAQINGLPMPEHTGKRLGEVAPEFAAGIGDACRSVLATGMAVTDFEFQAAPAGAPGAQHDWLVSLHPLRQPDGTVLGVTTVVSDITERKQFTARLTRQEKLLRLVIDGMPGLVCYLDRDYRYQFNNREYAEWYGRPVEQITGRTIAETLGAAVFARIQPYLERAFAGERITVEHPAVFGGRTREVRATYSPDRGPDGVVRGIVAVVQDITERKLSEQALRQSEERFRRIVEIAAEGILILDNEGVATFANARMGDLLGYTPEEIVGREFIDFMAPEEQERGRNNFRRRKLGDRSPREYRFRRHDGTNLWLDVTAAPMRDQDDVLTGVLTMCTDVTERKHSEQQLRQTQKLESLGILAGGIAHDFNNLLAGIMGNASLAAEALAPDAAIRPMLEDVVSGSERAAKLTRQLLAYAGRDHGTTEPVDLARLVRDLTPLLSSSTSKMVRIALDLDPVPLVQGDPAQLQQVLMNLVINAAESIPATEAGEVRIQLSRRRPMPEDRQNAVIPLDDSPGDYVVLTITDSGAGMDEATQARIFDPFFSTKFDGRGLGLSAVLGIVRAHRGTLALRSAPGKGTQFVVLLPASQTTRAVEHAAPVCIPRHPVRAPYWWSMMRPPCACWRSAYWSVRDTR